MLALSSPQSARIGGGGRRCGVERDRAGVGLLFETTTFDMVITDASWMLVRALQANPPRWAPCIGAGVLTGITATVKIVAAAMLACCLLSVLILVRASSLRARGRGSRL